MIFRDQERFQWLHAKRRWMISIFKFIAAVAAFDAEDGILVLKTQLPFKQNRVMGENQIMRAIITGGLELSRYLIQAYKSV